MIAHLRAHHGPVSLALVPLLVAVLVAVAVAVLVAVLIPPSPALADATAVERAPAVRADLDARGVLAVDEAGRPKATRLDLEMKYVKGGGRGGANIYHVTGDVAIAHPPGQVIAVAADLETYDGWAIAGLNDRAIHPRGERWETDILSMTRDRRGDLAIRARVLRFAEGTVNMRETERQEGAEGGGVFVLRYELRAANVLVSQFDYTFYVFPVADGRACAIRFEAHCGLTRPLDWWYRQKDENPVTLLKPRVRRYLENLLGEVARRYPAGAPAPEAKPAPPAQPREPAPTPEPY